MAAKRTMLATLVAVAVMMGGCPTQDAGGLLDVGLAEPATTAPEATTPPTPKNYDGWWELQNVGGSGGACVHIVNDQIMQWNIECNEQPFTILTALPSERIYGTIQWTFEEMSPESHYPGSWALTVEDQPDGALLGWLSTALGDGRSDTEVVILRRL